MDLKSMVAVEDPDEAKAVIRVPQPPNPSPSPPSLSTLRSVRKRSATAAKTRNKPMPMQIPPPPKVYRVDSINFRKVVQQLTGANGLRSRRLHRVAPPPLDLFTPPSHSDQTCKSTTQQEHSFNTGEREGFFSTSLSSSTIPVTVPGNSYMSNGSFRPFGSSATPPSYVPWSPSFPVLSPGTLASFEQSGTILY